MMPRPDYDYSITPFETFAITVFVAACFVAGIVFLVEGWGGLT
jgi:hypothetical protein